MTTKRGLGAALVVAVLIVGAQSYERASAAVSGASTPAQVSANSESVHRDTGSRSVLAPRLIAARTTPTVSASAAAPAATEDSQLLLDTGFEEGTSTSLWSQASTGGVQLIDTRDPHHGSWDADVCGHPGCTYDVLSQPFTVPSGITAATLTFWFAAYCPPSAPASCNSADNALMVAVVDQAGNSAGPTLRGSGAPGSVGSYQPLSLDFGSYLASRAGEVLDIDIFAANWAGDYGGFFVDDVTLTLNDPPENVVVTTPSYNTASVSWSPPPDAATNLVTGYRVELFGATRNLLNTWSVAASPYSITGLGGGPYYVTVAWVNPAVTGPSAESYSFTFPSSFVPPERGGGFSSNQYTLPNSDGTTWQQMDRGNLGFLMKPTATENVLLTASADLWTLNAGYNQDIGITVTSAADYVPHLAAWIEVGGSGGAFSPNPASLQTVYPMTAGTLYEVDLVWKTNRPALGVSISSGAGPLNRAYGYSLTQVDAAVLPAGSPTTVSTTQYVMQNSDGATWAPVDGRALAFAITPATTTAYLLSGNADMWTFIAGYNQDLAINVSPPCARQPSTIASWKESGGSGAFSPNSVLVQSVCQMTGGTQYTVSLVWKTNKPAPGAPIAIGAGPSGPFSPTRLTADAIPGASVPVSSGTDSWDTEVSSQQYALSNSDGSTWTEIDASRLVSSTLDAGGYESCTVTAAVDLWTSSPGYNQDVAIFETVDGGSPTLIGWRETGGGAAFSPNGVLLETGCLMQPGHTYVYSLWWKTNVPAPGGTIWAGAGPIAGAFSPTRLTVVPRAIP